MVTNHNECPLKGGKPHVGSRNEALRDIEMVCKTKLNERNVDIAVGIHIYTSQCTFKETKEKMDKTHNVNTHKQA